MCDAIGDISAAGASLVIIGNGSPDQARGFSGRIPIKAAIYTDPELTTYRAFGARRGLLTSLDPRTIISAVRALRRGHRQTQVMGDPLQQGGVAIILPDGSMPYRHVSDFAGDHPEPDAVIEELRRATDRHR